MDSDPNRNVGRTDLSGELGSVPAPRKTDPTPAVTCLGAGPSSAMVTVGNPVTSAGRSRYERRTGNRIQTGSRLPT